MSLQKTISAAALLAVVVSAPMANAQSREELRAACRGDVMRYCFTAMRERQKLFTCMSENQSRLSEDCRTAFLKARERMENG